MAIKIAVIGAGQMSQETHLPILKSLKDAGIYELALLCDINAQAVQAGAQNFGFTEWTLNADDIFARSDIRAVFIFGTAAMHFEYGMRALSAGKHIFIEKPPAPDTESALEMFQLAKEKNLIAAVGFNRRFQTNLNKAKTDIEQSSRIYSMEAFFHKASLGEPLRYGAKTWLGVNAIHSIDALCYLVGSRPVALYSALNSADGEMPHNFSALLVWGEGTQAVLASNNSGGSRYERYTIHSLEHSYYCDKARTLNISGPAGKYEEVFDATVEHQGFYGEHAEFAEALQNGTAIRNGLEHGIAAVHLMGLMEEGYCGEVDWSKWFGATTSANRLEERHKAVSITGRKSILVLNPNTVKSSLGKIKEKYELVDYSSLPQLSATQRAAIVAIINGRGAGDKRITTEVIESLPNLQVMGVNYVSVKDKNFNPEELISRGVVIINAGDVYAEAVAEFALMQTLVGLRSALRSHEVMRQGGWGIALPGSLVSRTFSRLKKMLLPLRAQLMPLWHKIKPAIAGGTIGFAYKARGGKYILHGATVGIVGYGAIARRFIELLQPFNCKIKVYSEFLTAEEAATLGVSRATMAEVLNAQVVSIHRGLSERTKKSFGKVQIDALKPGAVLVNTARAGVVNTEALLERLKKNDIFACLDVFDEEPLPANNPFRALPNVLLTSHISGSTDASYKAADISVVENVLKYLEGNYKGTVIQSLEMLQSMS
ncbi:MAG: Gfo/Idh/MocA family oxidoreductase [Candidatus Pacebacteria bacterium]|nr:Gfo/Idh/MocA family oxidoreductase [Candidatus Paceibacterota bacterium]